MSGKYFSDEVSSKQRFEFGKNWKGFINKLTDERIQHAEISLKDMLKVDNLKGKTFLDIGSGSGLSSLVAKKCGAKVTSFDFDDSSVWCTNKLKSLYFPDSSDWEIIQGSVLDTEFLKSLGSFDIVYSWGVLHHTGEMATAIDNASKLVNKDGLLFLAIYNDQGLKSHFWWMIKYLYNHLPGLLQKPFAYSLGFTIKFLMLIKYTLKLKPMIILSRIFNYQTSRGMSLLNDIVDWYGGFPYEFLKYEHLVRYVEGKGFKLVNGRKASSLGCHQVVFKSLRQ